MGIQFFGPMQIENCHPCQRLWLEQGELEKIAQRQKDKDEGNTTFSDVILGMDPNHESWASHFLVVDIQTAYQIQFAEYMTNKATNGLVETNLFKKYPVFTFCLIVAVFIGIRYCSRH